MNHEKLFDLVCAAKDAKGNKFTFDGKLVTPEKYTKTITKAVQAFVHQETGIIDPNNKKRSIQAFEGSSTLPELTKDVFNVTMQINEYDLLWQKSYKGIQLKKGQLSWEISDVSTGIVFLLIPEGGKIQYEKISGLTAPVHISKYGAALGITWETIEGRKLYKFVDQMESMRSALFTLWADIHYTLLATAGALNTISWQGSGTDRIIDRDIATLNLGALSNGTANKDKNFGVTATSQYLLYAGPALKARLNAAFRMTSVQATSGQGMQGVTIDFNIAPLYTFNSGIAANKALLVLPGRKIQNAMYLRELGLSKRDIETLNEFRTYWTAFGAAVGDTDQIYELSFA